ncbi:MAG: hypothetical protein JRN50_03885 [Nitrososphaerota archaeon]|nr:hypothetical protein [Nitrososphaerota archaeon]
MGRNHLIWAPDPVYSKLVKLRGELGYPTFGALINALALEHDGGGVEKAALPLVMADSRPFVVTGPSGCGKTTFAQQVLTAWSGPALVLDASNEYPELPSIKDSRDLDLNTAGKFRIVGSPNVDYAQLEASYLFRDLQVRRSDSALSRWLIIVEEAHRFANDAGLKALLLEGRKSIGKLLVLSADPTPWAQVAPIVRP